LGVKFRRQQVLGPIIVDFCCLEATLIVEVDGPYHHRRCQRELDRRRDVFVKAAGWTVLRFSNDQILNDVDSVLGRIRSALPQTDSAPICR
jgi:very-short-patch-repair endonuclease